MWETLQKISGQVIRYSTFLGQLWYVLVFVFRAFVVASIGGAVYGDEQGSFECSTEVVGCSNMCYNQFAKISHMRFWSFQLLAVITPTLLFHFYSMYTTAEIAKLKKENEEQQAMEGGYTRENENLVNKMIKRRKSIGKIKVRHIYEEQEDKLKEVVYTRKIHIVYYISIFCRIFFEVLFISLGYKLFKHVDHTCKYNKEGLWCEGNFLSFVWMKVPAMYLCSGGPGTDVYNVCQMHVQNGGHVPCFVSRPFEKTVLLCYMGVMSLLCLVISVLELILITIRKCRKSQKRNKQFFDNSPANNYCETIVMRDNNDYYPTFERLEKQDDNDYCPTYREGSNRSESSIQRETEPKKNSTHTKTRGGNRETRSRKYAIKYV